jgi:hypothetical protein
LAAGKQKNRSKEYEKQQNRSKAYLDSRRTEAKNNGLKQDNKSMECLGSRNTEEHKQKIWTAEEQKQRIS